MLVPAPQVLRRALTALALLASPAAGACLLSPAEVSELARQSAAAVLGDDVAAHQAAYDALLQGVGCLEGPLPTEPWAVILFDHAVVVDASGGDAGPWLAAVHDADPVLLERLRATTGRTSLRAWTPSSDAAPPAPLHADEVLVDGRPWSSSRTLAGPHVVQRHDREGWHTAWVEDGAVPSWWRAAPTQGKATVRALVGAGVGTQLFTPLASGALAEPAHKVFGRVEAGLHVDVGHVWVRVSGGVAFQPVGTWLYDRQGSAAATRWAGFGAVGVGGTVGRAELGAVAGWAQPARVMVRMLSGWLPDPAARIELTAGVNVLTDATVEPAGELSVVWTPRIAGRR